MSWPQIRTGIGYDVHRLEAGRKLVLGGVTIQHRLGLLGHSDADVLCHAIGDALLGAAALGDLGKYFPPSDMKYKDANSLTLLKEISRLVDEAGYKIGNVDSMLMCEAPKIAPHIIEMKANIAQSLGIKSSAVGVKATTNEKLGFLGREEGIAAMATALLIEKT